MKRNKFTSLLDLTLVAGIIFLLACCGFVLVTRPWISFCCFIVIVLILGATLIEGGDSLWTKRKKKKK